HLRMGGAFMSSLPSRRAGAEKALRPRWGPGLSPGKRARDATAPDREVGPSPARSRGLSHPSLRQPIAREKGREKSRPPRRSSRPARCHSGREPGSGRPCPAKLTALRSEEHTSELQSRENLVCRLLLEKKKQKNT